MLGAESPSTFLASTLASVLDPAFRGVVKVQIQQDLCGPSMAKMEKGQYLHVQCRSMSQEGTSTLWEKGNSLLWAFCNGTL